MSLVSFCSTFSFPIADVRRWICFSLEISALFGDANRLKSDCFAVAQPKLDDFAKPITNLGNRIKAVSHGFDAVTSEISGLVESAF
jgi:hypothetical protein